MVMKPEKKSSTLLKMRLEGEVEATETEARRHPLGLTRLAGELFKLKMLKDSQRLTRTLLQAAAHLWETTGWTSTLGA